MWPTIMIIILVILAVLLIVTIPVARKKQEEIKKTGKYPEGHFVGMWMGIGTAIFSGVGIALSTTTGNSGLIGIGPALGIGFGLAIGQSIENKYKKEGKIRPLTEQEKKLKQKMIWVAMSLLILGLIAGLVFYFMR